MKSNAALHANLCPSCGAKLEQFLVEPVFSDYDNHLQTINVGCPHCGLSAEVTIMELTQALVRQVLKRSR